ncbi:MAG TPA: carboxypeptidase-like regulatory domain-containing protein, partial [Chitinophagaceae bacterium]|nr:carboxypeptidase-like regulatory domain-containing protein [Chitinophagaceae bacterium]
MRKCKAILMAVLGISLLPLLVAAQGRSVTGKVTDKNGSPIPGASILVNQSGQGTITDMEGNFSLTVPANAKAITVNSTSFKSQSISMAGVSSALQVRLEEDVARLDEVVITGLATSVRRRNLANAVVTISSKQLSGIAPAQTLDATLQGKIPGALINANSGAPGGGGSVKLRGVTSVFGNTQPLYVVDGVFVDNTATSAGLNAITGAVSGGSATSNQDNPSSRIADIRAEDIENIEILKGASAAAIYGSKASAGVIIITTRRGRQGKTAITLSQDLGEIRARKFLGVRAFNADRAASLSSDSATGAAYRQQFLAAEAAGEIYDYEKEVYGN